MSAGTNSITPFPSKLPEVGTTIFTVMTNMANTHQAINLSQGFPNFDVDSALIAIVEKYMREGKNQYAPMQGVIELRHAIAHKVSSLSGNRYDAEKNVTITAGATEALFAAIMCAVEKGDEVIIFEPAYDSYSPTIRLAGGIPVPLAMMFPHYSIDWDKVKDSINKKTKLIILNSPHNPSGTIITEKDIKALMDITRGTNILILSDEVYEHIVFDGCIHESMLRYEELAARSFAIGSLGKTYHATGWKVGYCIAPEYLTEEFRKVHQFLTFAVNTPVQYAYAEYMKREETYLQVASFYQRKRDLFLNLIRNSKFRPLPCKGTYFQMLDYSEITDESDVVFAERLVKEFKVAAIPPSVFYHNKQDNHVLRFCFAKQDSTLEKAAERLCSI